MKCQNKGCVNYSQDFPATRNCMKYSRHPITLKDVCRNFTDQPTLSITSERLQELEDKEKWNNPPEGEWELSAELGRKVAQIEELQATIKELTADQERLDWLEDMLSDCMLSLTESHIEDKENWLLSEKFGFATPRQAIDKARKGEKD